jgi:periplasmic protein CpxP/Spy
MRRKLIGLVVLGVLVFGAVGFASAGPWMRGMGGWAADPDAKIEAIGNLNLSDGQFASIREMLNAQFERQESLRVNLARKMHEYRLMFWQSDPDREAIGARMAEMNELREQMRESMPLHEQIGGLLTEEQRAALEEMRGQRAERREGMMQKMQRGIRKMTRTR